VSLSYSGQLRRHLTQYRAHNATPRLCSMLCCFQWVDYDTADGMLHHIRRKTQWCSRRTNCHSHIPHTSWSQSTAGRLSKTFERRSESHRFDWGPMLRSMVVVSARVPQPLRDSTNLTRINTRVSAMAQNCTERHSGRFRFKWCTRTGCAVLWNLLKPQWKSHHEGFSSGPTHIGVGFSFCFHVLMMVSSCTVELKKERSYRKFLLDRERSSVAKGLTDRQ